MFEQTDIKYNCKYFKGDIPCIPNKARGKVCPSCDEFVPVSKQILIIKLGAIGDVIRTTPLAVNFKKSYPDCNITWLTYYPDVLPSGILDNIYYFDFKSSYILTELQFDIAVNLDKDKETCILLSKINAKKKYGFTWIDGHIAGLNEAAGRKLLTGLFDEYSKSNTKSYQEEIFEICDLKFGYEPTLIELDQGIFNNWSSLRTKTGTKKIIGLNTGCGKRWLTRLWPSEKWINLAILLQQNDYFPVFLGGPDENEMNLNYAKQTGVYYPGVFTLKEFIAITAQCDLIITSVSMMMHIAISLEKPLILFNNIFNKNEFELYGRGEIIEPDSGCDCYYGNICKRERHCMEDISVEKVMDIVIKLLSIKR